MKRTLISTAAAALLLASQGSAFAQPRDRGDGPGGNPGAGPQAPGPGPGSSPGGNPGAGPGPGRDAAPPASRPQAPSPAQRGPVNTPKAERPERPAQQRAEPKAPNVEKQQRTSEPKAPSKQQPTPQADGKGKGKDADPKRTTRDATPKADSKSESKAETKAAPGKEADRVGRDKSQDKGKGPGVAKGEDKGHGDRMAGQQDMRQARDRLDRSERVRLHDAFDRRRARANINIDIRVGRNVPRSVRLVPVPRTVIAFFPYYRDYSYFAVGDTICIVDPRSYEVVDVIDEGYRNAQPTQQARLSLDAAQMALVRDSIPSDMRVERISLRLALGAEIPRDVELHRFEPRVVDTVRDLERYRFVLVEDEIVVVDPSDRSIALVIDRT